MKTIPLLILFAVVHCSAEGQSLSNQVIASAGRYFAGGNAGLESTTGEAVIPTLEAGGFILTQGFHQPSSNGIPISVEENTPDEILAYPNPVSDLLTLSSTSTLIGMVVYIFDAAGKLAYTDQLVGTNETIRFSTLANGLYLLQVRSGSGEIHYQTKLTHVN